MFNFFKRSAATKVNPARKPTARKPSSTLATGQGLDAPVPIPEVIEGNEESDWALWEDSVWAQDSQMQSLTPSVRIYQKEEAKPSQYENLNDVFSSVRRKGP